MDTLIACGIVIATIVGFNIAIGVYQDWAWNRKIPKGRMSSEKCPKCDHWATRDEPHVWRLDESDPSVDVMTCTCGHESRWIMGPGIMICVDEGLANEAT